MDKKSVICLLKESVSLFIDNFPKFLGLIVLFFLPLAIGYLVIFALTAGAITFLGLQKDLVAAFVAVFSFLMAAGFLCWGVFYSIALIKMVAVIDKGESLKVTDAYRQAIPLFAPFFLVYFLVAIKVFLWSLLFVIPGIIFAIFYTFTQFSVIIDGKRGREALVFSRNIIQPQFWQFITKISLVMIIMIGVTLGLKMLSGLLPIIGEILLGIFNIFEGAFATIFLYLLYKDFKSILETQPV